MPVALAGAGKSCLVRTRHGKMVHHPQVPRVSAGSIGRARELGSPDDLSSARISHSRFAKLQGVCTRTIDRWVQEGILEQPIRIKGRKYWDPNTRPKTG